MGRPGPGLIAFDLTTKEEGVDGLDELECVWEREKLKPGLVLVLEATELLGLMTRCCWSCKPPDDWVNFRCKAGLRVTPRNAGLVGEIARLWIGLGKAGLAVRPISHRAGLETEFFTPATRKWFIKEAPANQNKITKWHFPYRQLCEYLACLVLARCLLYHSPMVLTPCLATSWPDPWLFGPNCHFWFSFSFHSPASPVV